MAKKSGVRINQLAKDLGVDSKAILQKLRDEGLGDKAPNHQSTVPLGLAESIKEWFAGGGGVAVEVAPPVEAKTKTKPSVRRAKPRTDEDGAHATDEDGEPGDAVADTGVTVSADAAPAVTTQTTAGQDDYDAADAPTAPVVPTVTVSPEPRATPVADAIPTVVEPTVTVPATPIAPQRPDVTEQPRVAAEAPKPTAAPATRPIETAQQPDVTPTTPPRTVAPATATPGVPPRAPVDHRQPPQMRPTITLANRLQQQQQQPGGAGGAAAAAAERKAPIAAKPFVPAPAQVRGPNVVREEKPDHVPAPRPRGPRMGGPMETPGFTTARPATGRGVKTADDGEEDKEKAAAKNKSLSARRRGPDGRRGEAEEKLREFTEADLIERRDRLNAAATYRSGVNSHLKQRNRQLGPSKTIVQKGEPVAIDFPVTVRSLAEALAVKTNAIMSQLMKQGVFATVNQALDLDVAALIADGYGIELKVRGAETQEELLLKEFEERPVDEANLAGRAPVVTILGHVDHGKTSLLDKIRSANVAAGEAGGITQHTAAWMVELDRNGTRKRVTFIDTPGHQAFTSMRARGANMTDVVVLVVSAAEGVQPQTIESINHAKAAEVPIVVAMNKIDRPDANDQKVLGELAAQGLNPVEWGGDTEVVRTSAITGQGIEDLIEILDYQAELLNLQADPTSPARGTVIESRVDPGLGPVATVLVQDGTLKVGDVIISGPGYGRIRSLLNDRGQMITEAAPATPVIVSGMDVLPNAGDNFFIVSDIERARTIAEERQNSSRQQQLASRQAVTLDSIFASMKEGDIKTINLIIKADVQGSVETLAGTVAQHNTDEVRVRVIHSAVGPISESDVELAYASDAVIIGFHVVPDDAARAMAEQKRVEVRLYRVIYEIFDDLKKALSGMLEPEIREKLHGHVEVRQVFKVSRIGNIGGCFVTDGHIQRGSKIRLIRDGVVITEDLAIDTLRRVKDDVREVKAGFECGIKLAGYDDIKVGDRFEAYIRETIERHL